MGVILGIFGGIIILSLITGIILTHNENKENSLITNQKLSSDVVQDENHDKNNTVEVINTNEQKVTIATEVNNEKGVLDSTVIPKVEEVVSMKVMTPQINDIPVLIDSTPIDNFSKQNNIKETDQIEEEII